MRRFVAFTLLWAVFAAGCSNDKNNKTKSSSDDSSSGDSVGAYVAEGPREQKADLLPADTIGYFRFANVQQMKSHFVQSKHVADAAQVQAEIDKMFDEPNATSGFGGRIFGVSPESATKIFKSVRTMHMAISSITETYDFDGPGGEPERTYRPASTIMILEVDSMDAVDDHLKSVDRVEKKTVDGREVLARKRYEDSTQAEALCKLDDHTLVVTQHEQTMNRVLATIQAGVSDSFGQSAEFRKAYDEYGAKGDVFAYMSFDALRKNEPDVPKFLSSLAGYADVGGELTVRLKTGGGMEFPEFLAGRAKPKQFLDRIPADAVYVVDSTFNGGRETREAFFAWLKNELESPEGLGKSLPPEITGQAREMLRLSENLETEMVVGGPAMLLAAIPVQSELAMFVAPNSAGKWGVAMFCDVEEQSKAELLVSKLRDLEKEVPFPLNWETSSIGGTTVNFVDFGKVIPPNAMPDDVKRSLDFRVGYALNHDLLLFGTVGAIEYALQPSGSTYADRIKWDDVDRDNMMLLSLAPGSFVHHKFGIPPMDDVLTRIAKEIPRDANYTVTLNIEKQDATLRTNVPLSSLIGWLVVEFASENGGPAKLREAAGWNRTSREAEVRPFTPPTTDAPSFR